MFKHVEVKYEQLVYASIRVVEKSKLDEYQKLFNNEIFITPEELTDSISLPQILLKKLNSK
ncbi:hypothetical protein, partial [Arthrobacter sp. C152]